MGTPGPRLLQRAIRAAPWGGNFPVINGRVYLFAASTTGYGTASTPLLIDDGISDVQTDGNGNACCSPIPAASNPEQQIRLQHFIDQLYVLIAGGNPGLADSSTDNEALALMAALGTCGSSLTLDPNSFIVVNEVTTVASVYSLSQFMTDATHISTSGFNLSGLANAFATASNLATNSSGIANTTFDQIALGVTRTVTAPHDEIDYLANALAPCVNSDGTGSGCTSLYAASGNTAASVPPTDTVQAMLAIARAPAAHEHLVYELPTGLGEAPFDTSLAEPNDWSVVLTYTGGNNDGSLAVLDANGALWSVGTDTLGNNFVTGISNNGTPLTGPTGLYSTVAFPSLTGGFIGSIAFDTYNNLWLDESDYCADGTSIQVAGYNVDHRFAPSDHLGLPAPAWTSQALIPRLLIIDGNNHIWTWMFSGDPSVPGSIDMFTPDLSGNYALATSGFPSANGGSHTTTSSPTQAATSSSAGSSIPA